MKKLTLLLICTFSFVFSQAQIFNANGVSQIEWPFAGTPSNNTQGWYHSCGSGCGEHTGDDYHAQDWVRGSDPQHVTGCGCSFYAPISGTVLWSGENEYGQAIAIESDINPSFVFYVAHLKARYVYAGNHVNLRQNIGKIGRTGVASNNICHPHMVLYKNATASNKSHMQSYGYFPGNSNNAAKFNIENWGLTPPAPSNLNVNPFQCGAIFSWSTPSSSWWIDIVPANANWNCNQFYNKPIPNNVTSTQIGNFKLCSNQSVNFNPTENTTYKWRIWNGYQHFYPPAGESTFTYTCVNSCCTNTFLYPSYSVTIANDQNFKTITGCQWAGDYAKLIGVKSGRQYQFKSSRADYLTVRVGSPGGPVLDCGWTPLTVVTNSNQNLFLHTNTSSGCGTQNTCRITQVKCVNCFLYPAVEDENNNVFTVVEGERLEDIKLYPNPASNEFQVQFNYDYNESAGQENNQPAAIQIFDLGGKLVRLEEIPVYSGLNEFRMSDIDELSEGLYVVQVKLPDGTTRHSKLAIHK